MLTLVHGAAARAGPVTPYTGMGSSGGLCPNYCHMIKSLKGLAPGSEAPRRVARLASLETSRGPEMWRARRQGRVGTRPTEPKT